jgi:hypothetical protein
VLRSVDDIRALKSETGRDIVTTGSIQLVRELIAAGLVDEYRLFTYPVVVGRGKRLFAEATEVPRLRLAESQPFRSGIVLLRTGQPDGASRALANGVGDGAIAFTRKRRRVAGTLLSLTVAYRRLVRQVTAMRAKQRDGAAVRPAATRLAFESES